MHLPTKGDFNPIKKKVLFSEIDFNSPTFAAD
jgi:hypothetical protein